MKNFKSIILLLTLLAVFALTAEASTLKELFIEESGQVFPLLNRKVKMDMIDYCNEGVYKDFPNALGDGCRINKMSDNHLSINTSKNHTVELLLTQHKKDSIIVAITTVNLPAKDSRIEFFNTRWEKLDTKKFFKEPSMKNFIKIPKGDKTKKETVLNSIDFPIICYSINPAKNVINARHSLKSYMSKDDYEKIAPYLVDSLAIPIK